MEEHPPDEPAHGPHPGRRMIRDEIAQELLALRPVLPYPELIEVPKYPVRVHDRQTEVLEKADYAELCWLLAPRIDSRVGIRSEYGYRWDPDEIGRIHLRQQIRKLLIESGDFLAEELEDWTLTQILPALAVARERADEALRAKQKAQLQEPFELGLQYAARWQDYVREAVAIVMQYHARRRQGHKGLRAPFPDMVDSERAGSRQYDEGDIPWMFFVLGEKLEGVFDVKGTFVPADLREDIITLISYIHPNVDRYVDGKMSADQLNDLWVIIRPVLLGEEVKPVLASDHHRKAREGLIARPVHDGDEVSHSDDYRSVKYNGHDFAFTENQAAAVKLLWEQEGGELGQAYILEKIDSATDRLRNVFKRKGGMHPAWGTLILRGQTKGTFRLAPPENNVAPH